MQCKEFAFVLEKQGLSPLSAAAQDHLASCPACQDLLADISSIVDSAKQLPAEMDPPQRIWVSLRAQLETEGLIKEPVAVVPESSPSWLQNLGAWFTPRSLATAGVGITLAIAAFLTLQKTPVPANPSGPAVQQQAKQQAPSQVQPRIQPQAQPQGQSQTQLSAQQTPRSKPLAVNPPPTAPEFTPPPSVDVYYARSAALNQAENDVPSSRLADNPALDESLRKNLRTVNEFIAECEAHLKKHPQDMLAREYLNSAYQQKAELLAAMLDSGRSEQ